MKSLFVIGLLLVSTASHASQVDCTAKIEAAKAAAQEVGRIGALIEIATSQGIADGDGLTEKLTEAIVAREKATVDLQLCIQLQQGQR